MALTKLPPKYNANQVIGITEGGMRPTVYFSDGSRFTQSHETEGNVGFHEPPSEVLFAGNISNNQVKEIHKMNTEQHLAYAAKFVLNKPPRPRHNVIESFNTRYYEVHRNGVNGGTPHLSRGKLTPVSGQKAVDLIKNIRARSENRVRDYKSAQFYFEDELGFVVGDAAGKI